MRNLSHLFFLFYFLFFIFYFKGLYINRLHAARTIQSPCPLANAWFWAVANGQPRIPLRESADAHNSTTTSLSTSGACTTTHATPTSDAEPKPFPNALGSSNTTTGTRMAAGITSAPGPSLVGVPRAALPAASRQARTSGWAKRTSGFNVAAWAQEHRPPTPPQGRLVTSSSAPVQTAGQTRVEDLEV